MRKHILVMIALMVAIVSCGHVDEHFDHQHHESADLCGIASEPCSCHSCESYPCTDQVKIQLNRASNAIMYVQPSASAVLFALLEAKPLCKKSILPISGILDALQTVQLLI